MVARNGETAALFKRQQCCFECKTAVFGNGSVLICALVVDNHEKSNEKCTVVVYKITRVGNWKTIEGRRGHSSIPSDTSGSWLTPLKMNESTCNKLAFDCLLTELVGVIMKQLEKKLFSKMYSECQNLVIERNDVINNNSRQRKRWLLMGRNVDRINKKKKGYWQTTQVPFLVTLLSSLNAIDTVPVNAVYTTPLTARQNWKWIKN